MSAIAGIFHTNREPVPIENIQKMMESLHKYPANDVGTFQIYNLFFGCHAQWITPESIGEKLPYYDHRRKLAITADAIIDNREELFEMLQVEAHKRDDIPDSELILIAYFKWGEVTPKYLVGDFSFMIWDEERQQLFGARDFSGSRPLYYYKQDTKFAFCTTMEPLLTLPYINRELNEQWVAEFLAISSVIDTVDCSITPYKMIHQVPPAHSIIIKNNQVLMRKYCNIIPDKKLKLQSEQEYVEGFQEVFQKAVKSRLRTYRGVGAHLSGGLDSGSVVSFAAKELREENKQLHTFSYIPPSDFKDYTSKRLLPDERPYIKATVNYIGGLKDYYFDFKDKNSYTDIDEYLDILEMPYKYFENSFWIKGMFEKANSENVGVLLNGGRGNFTISWGHALNYYAELMKKMKMFKLFHELNQYSKKAGGARFRMLPTIAKVAFPIFNKISTPLQLYTFPTLINSEFSNKINVFSKLQDYGIDESGWFSTTNIYEQRRRHFDDLFHWNATNILAAKLSLKYNVWKRDSTNDLRVVKFCLSVPESLCVSNGFDRALIRKSTKNYLPDRVRLNQQIRGVQGADWLHRILPHWNELISELEMLVQDKNVLTFLDESVIKAALQKAKNGAVSENAADPDFKILMRSLIFYRYLKKHT